MSNHRQVDSLANIKKLVTSQPFKICMSEEMKKEHLSVETIHNYVHGGLSPAQEDDVMRHTLCCQECALVVYHVLNAEEEVDEVEDELIRWAQEPCMSKEEQILHLDDKIRKILKYFRKKWSNINQWYSEPIIAHITAEPSTAADEDYYRYKQKINECSSVVMEYMWCGASERVPASIHIKWKVEGIQYEAEYRVCFVDLEKPGRILADLLLGKEQIGETIFTESMLGFDPSTSIAWAPIFRINEASD